MPGEAWLGTVRDEKKKKTVEKSKRSPSEQIWSSLHLKRCPLCLNLGYCASQELSVVLLLPPAGTLMVQDCLSFLGTIKVHTKTVALLRWALSDNEGRRL